MRRIRMKAFSVHCLGVGDGWSCADRNHASFFYRFGSTRILVDCGEPVDRSLKEAGVRHGDLDAILLSHMHSDHVGGLFMLMQGAWLCKRREPLPLFMPGKAIRTLGKMFEAAMLFPELIGFELRPSPLKSRRSISLKDVRVTPFPTSHLENLRSRFEKKHPVDFSAFSFLFESKGRRVAHSADIGKPEDLAPLLEKPLDLLVCEMSHNRPEKLFGYLSRHRIRKIVFVHLSDAQWRNVSDLRIKAAKFLKSTPHVFAKDGERVVF